MSSASAAATYYRSPPMWLLAFNLMSIWTILPILSFKPEFIFGGILPMSSSNESAYDFVVSNQFYLKAVFYFIVILHSLEVLLTIFITAVQMKMSPALISRWIVGVFINGIMQLRYLLVVDYNDDNEPNKRE